MAETIPLRRRMIEDMTVRNLSPTMRQGYTYAVEKFSRFLTARPIGSTTIRTMSLDDLGAQIRVMRPSNSGEPAVTRSGGGSGCNFFGRFAENVVLLRQTERVLSCAV